ncbi:MAG TPA: DNA-protecting protein DprA [Oscillatoriaceae cyanobacterium M33_DOE_052]|uniref:DNA-protecting protein DprA n=1 Tax=Planktothricoides sp. SpSt-374 TaxID=2282167 RepID=A0A7C3VHZ2_9CYAN|nr:DNA-protecting protein DprA [Oscillatoriaceae cyanobacterium M33_DOE_052]
MSEERIYWLAWAQIPGIGPILLQRMQAQFGSVAAAWTAPATALAEVEGFGRQTVEKVIKYRSSINPTQFYQQHLEKNPQFWTPADPEYPHLLLETASPAPVLYYRGQIDREENLGNRPLIGIVGTRKPTEYGKYWTRRLSYILGKQGFTIVSGMAAGIDTAAHQGCLEGGGRTIAVFGTPLDKIYPEQNRPLAGQICHQGVLLSEHPYGTKTLAGHFPQRNRIIAGISRAVLVMEAPNQSGSLITARLANEFGRDVYALPGRIDDANSQGCLRLLKNGAEAILSEDELLASLGAIPQLDAPQPPTLEKPDFSGESFLAPKLEPKKLVAEPEKSVTPLPDLEPELKQVLEATPPNPIPFDLIVEETGLPSGNVSSALLHLELLGLVSQLPGMRYQRCI